ncbi:ATP-binding cassette sub-family B member 6, mitochondrial [Polychytrium aggregatum]|uniref:ATP-binding cassette sub-family B member 6, mitochondrial n=1 Tax=Polychytrium aggregatum TaxID=110093 RepID=UPI0022FDF0A1|nr:ATP-binding cassette sub-family B member 6, mitochondrial [Polychytrium aggregatum]KAI9207679.1 ATP-binding cassette sub-family B member 6, mitochondrial [Polychytrium aggregatum]
MPADPHAMDPFVSVPFCPQPQFIPELGILSPCVLRTLLSVLLIVFAAVRWIGALASRYRSHQHSDEEEPLLPDDDEEQPAPSVHGSSIAPPKPLSPSARRTIAAARRVVLWTILVSGIEIAGFLLSRLSPGSLPAPATPPRAQFIVLYTLAVLPWAAEYFAAPRYPPTVPSTASYLFWGYAWALATIEAAHLWAYLGNASKFPEDSYEVEAPRPTETGEPDKYAPPKTLGQFSRHIRRLMPFLWPSGIKNWRLQLMVMCCGVLLILGRAVNLWVPKQYKRLIEVMGDDRLLDMLSTSSSFTLEQLESVIPWPDLLLFVFLRLLQGNGGLLAGLQTYLWIPVGQFTTREISIKMFEHLHHLSLRFHLNRKTGEILRVQDRGVASIVSLLSSILFNVIPTLIDIVVACIYFTMEFDLTFGMIVFVTMVLYLIVTITITEWRTKYKKLTNQLDNEMEAKAVDSLLNFETVKYYNAESYEVAQYTQALNKYQHADLINSLSQSALNTAQNFIVQFGLLIGCGLCARRVIIEKTMTIGDLVQYLSYITQLYGPLNYFGNYYRVIQKNFVDMEKMLDLLDEPIEVDDDPNAVPLVVTAGEVEFENVCFYYDARRPILRNISFKIEAGSTVALVGPTGSGKSTILRLLFRFYDVQEGRITIDGQDIRSVKLGSLRSVIGVVPQDTVLFNDTMRYNILYGRPEASEEELCAATKAAQIHDSILCFPDGFDTRVGERGLRLSGGEKQRVAIARTILKDPKIVLLDEATSALDTHTERQIQAALQRMTANRTTLIVAHRLSTVIHADVILVLHKGEIVERGNHAELMQKRDGVYHEMWMKQLRDEEAHRHDARESHEAGDSNGSSSSGKKKAKNKVK